MDVGLFRNPNQRYKREIYLDWDFCKDYLGRYGIDQFCNSSSITISQLISIVNEFENDNINFMELGIEPGHLSDIRDKDYRWELYLDWISLKEHLPDFDKVRFCRNKGISQEQFEKIIKEFKK